MSARNPTVPDAAVLAFLDGWRELQHGDITAGGSLVVRYEPSRLQAPAKEIVGYARFLPGGQIRHATLRERRAPRTTAVAAEIPVPPETGAWTQFVMVACAAALLVIGVMPQVSVRFANAGTIAISSPPAPASAVSR